MRQSLSSNRINVWRQSLDAIHTTHRGLNQYYANIEVLALNTTVVFNGSTVTVQWKQ